MTKACGIVPARGMPSGAQVLLAPSAPPIQADRSIIWAIAGCCRRDPNEKTDFSPARAFIPAVAVAIPHAWQRNPRIDVSYRAKSLYLPLILRTGSRGKKSDPSGMASRSTGTPSRRDVTSSIPHRIPKPPGIEDAVHSIVTSGCIPDADRTASLLKKYTSVHSPLLIRSSSTIANLPMRVGGGAMEIQVLNGIPGTPKIRTWLPSNSV